MSNPINILVNKMNYSNITIYWQMYYTIFNFDIFIVHENADCLRQYLHENANCLKQYLHENANCLKRYLHEKANCMCKLVPNSLHRQQI